MNASQLLILHKEHGLSVKDISLVLNVHQKDVELILKGRIKPTRTKRSWRKKFPK